ncbi:MAG: hypothetical protein Q9N34_04670 [Aquificota bacterium]|nr:hypothetical protein [Aquificota bacterium]
MYILSSATSMSLSMLSPSWGKQAYPTLSVILNISEVKVKVCSEPVGYLQDISPVLYGKKYKELVSSPAGYHVVVPEVFPELLNNLFKGFVTRVVSVGIVLPS